MARVADNLPDRERAAAAARFWRSGPGGGALYVVV